VAYCLDRAIDRAKQRRPFGRPLAANQAMQFPIVELVTQSEMLRAFIRQTAWRMDTSGTFSASQEVSMAAGPQGRRRPRLTRAPAGFPPTVRRVPQQHPIGTFSRGEARMDALDLLTADHNRVRGLFSRFQAAEGAHDGEAARLATTIFEELEVHTRIEEDLFYPTVSDCNEEIHELVTEGIEEHHVVDDIMAEAKAVDPSDETWAAKLKVLIENVEHHAEEEEQELFPLVRKALDRDARAELGRRLEARKAEMGAPTAADKAHFSTDELNRLAREQEIPGRSSMKRDELLATVAPHS
jgi:hemerythrin superfamily protein